MKFTCLIHISILIHSYRISDLDDPKERMLQGVRWYLSAFHAGRKGAVAKKPYNPLLGETFSCFWDIEDTETDGGVNQKNSSHEVSSRM